jgi:predicted nucleic acid-binding protein
VNPEILCDAGPLVALLDEDDSHHAACVAAAKGLPARPLLTTWPCFTEAMYLAYRAGKFPMQERLWHLRRTGRVEIHGSGREEADRMEELVRQYRDTPMDLADASLVAAAEALGANRVFTIDGHFRTYRIHGKHAFEILP